VFSPIVVVGEPDFGSPTSLITIGVPQRSFMHGARLGIGRLTPVPK